MVGGVARYREAAVRPGASTATLVNCSIAIDDSMASPWGFDSSHAGIVVRAGTAAGTAEVLGMRVGSSVALWSKAKGKPPSMLAKPVAAGPDAINQWGKKIQWRSAGAATAWGA